MTALQFSEAELLAGITGLMWTFARVGALFVAAPIFGARTVPVRIRLALALLVAFILAPLVTTPAYVEPFSLPGVLLLLREILIGLAMGFLLQMMFAAFAIAGELIALSMGLAFASMVDPERGGSVPLVSQYFVIMSTLLFLAMQGHLALLHMLVESFHALPPAYAGLGEGGFRALANWGGSMFNAAVFVALPASASLLVAGVSMGLIARSAPQLNIFAVGFPMTLLFGVVVLFLSGSLLGAQLEEVMTAFVAGLRDMLGGWR